MVQFTSAFFVVASVAMSCMAVTVSDVKNNIATIISDAKGLDTTLAAFPGSSWMLSGLQAIQQVNAVQDAIDDTTTDIKNLPQPLSATDSQTLLKAIAPISTQIPNSLKAVEAKKAQFAAIPIYGDLIVAAVGKKLVDLRASITEVEQALAAAMAASTTKSASVTALKTAVDNAFTSVLKSYAASICAAN